MDYVPESVWLGYFTWLLSPTQALMLMKQAHYQLKAISPALVTSSVDRDICPVLSFEDFSTEGILSKVLSYTFSVSLLQEAIS